MTKTSITIELDAEVKKILDKRAKKEMMTLKELVSDILRRSTLLYKGKVNEEDKVDDKFLSYFSRKK